MRHAGERNGQRGLKRSAAITLVLVGVAGCSQPDPQRDVYTSLADCQRDWNGPAQCQPVKDGRYSGSWYYGPDHYGKSWSTGAPRSSPNAIEATRSPRGTSVSTSLSRGGFGSTGHGFSSGS